MAAGVVTLTLSSPVLAMQPLEDLKGKGIRNQQGEEIGTIEEVLINPQGTIEAVVVEEGGFLGIGGEDRRIDWNNLSLPANHEYLIYSETAAPQQDQSGPGSKKDSLATQQNSQQPDKQNDQMAKQQDQSKPAPEKDSLEGE